MKTSANKSSHKAEKINHHVVAGYPIENSEFRSLMSSVHKTNSTVTFSDCQIQIISAGYKPNGSRIFHIYDMEHDAFIGSKGGKLHDFSFADVTKELRQRVRNSIHGNSVYRKMLHFIREVKPDPENPSQGKGAVNLSHKECNTLSSGTILQMISELRRDAAKEGITLPSQFVEEVRRTRTGFQLSLRVGIIGGATNSSDQDKQ